jgi:hypothetical protein
MTVEQTDDDDYASLYDGGEDMIHDGKGMAWARRELGWSHLEMALALRMEGPDQKLKGRVHEMEIGTRTPHGSMYVAIEAYLDGWRPEGFVLGQRV